MNKREEILDFLRANKELLRSKYSIAKIGIFGSYARNEQTEKSDIDFILEYEENATDLFNKDYSLREYLKSAFKKDVDICHEGSIKPIFKPYILKDTIYV
jgi:predicted nucleotidyltransferase